MKNIKYIHSVIIILRSKVCVFCCNTVSQRATCYSLSIKQIHIQTLKFYVNALKHNSWQSVQSPSPVIHKEANDLIGRTVSHISPDILWAAPYHTSARKPNTPYPPYISMNIYLTDSWKSLSYWRSPLVCKICSLCPSLFSSSWSYSIVFV